MSRVVVAYVHHVLVVNTSLILITPVAHAMTARLGPMLQTLALYHAQIALLELRPLVLVQKVVPIASLENIVTPRVPQVVLLVQLVSFLQLVVLQMLQHVLIVLRTLTPLMMLLHLVPIVLMVKRVLLEVPLVLAASLQHLFLDPRPRGLCFPPHLSPKQLQEILLLNQI
jgi:hypothetical protein